MLLEGAQNVVQLLHFQHSLQSLEDLGKTYALGCSLLQQIPWPSSLMSAIPELNLAVFVHPCSLTLYGGQVVLLWGILTLRLCLIKVILGFQCNAMIR